MYEEGRYVIFAAGKINAVERVRNYVDFFALRFFDVSERQAAIDALIKASVYSCSIDVRPDDQLLLLVTCVENDNERRVVAARCIRDGESEAELKKIAERSWKKQRTFVFFIPFPPLTIPGDASRKPYHFFISRF